jgi:8-oxo-dGTP pyrophosphatase MutT (NUDIX family)
MPMSDYVRRLRNMIGTTVLEVPTVAVLTFDDEGRVLLVRHAEGNDWSTPGGMIEPYEIPSDAAVREMWEETGLHVELTRLIGVFGGQICTSRYGNGDELSWVATVFEGKRLDGELRPDGVETLETRYFAHDEARRLRCKPHVAMFLEAGWSAQRDAHFQPASWRPPMGAGER